MSSTPYNWELLTEHAAFSPRDTSEGIVFRDKMWLSMPTTTAMYWSAICGIRPTAPTGRK